MKHLSHWILALLVITTVASFSGAWTITQEPQKKERKVSTPSQGKKHGNRDRAARYEAIKKAMPAFKVTLSEAIQLAEKEAGGKAFSADVKVEGAKPTILVSLFVNDKFTMTNVDPVTKKVTVSAQKVDEDEEAGEDEEGG